MSLLKFLNESSVTRRSVLKGIGAAVATASVAGCSSGSSDDNAVKHRDDLKYEKADRYAFNTGPFNCGSKCVHKYHIKNGRIFAMTSAGDIPQNDLNENDPNNTDEWSGCEANKPMQYRSCVRGYSYIQRAYQPDRLKYPLMQTRERGDTSGFKRISWDEAYEKIGDMYVELFKRWKNDGYKYIPAFDGFSVVDAYANAVGATYLKRCSNASNGNSEAAKLDAVGGAAFRNSKTDNLNAGFIIIWGCDPTRHSNHENGSYWPFQKAKEANVPIVTISPVCTDQAAIYSKSVRVNLPSHAVFGDAKQVTIPGWVPIRPGTDGALLAGMMYVLYRREAFDKNFLTQGAKRKCFGFWKEDSAVSVAPAGSMGGYPNNEIGVTPGTEFAGKTFTVPAGKSFEEYLASREAEWGRSSVTNIGKVNSDADYIAVSDVDKKYAYDQVLLYVTRLTGVPQETIEALAMHFANNGSGKPSKVDCGCGPQRQYAGAEFVWLVICLTAMTGWIDKKGGGPAIGMGSLPDNSAFATKTNKKASGTNVNNRPVYDKDGNRTQSFFDIQGQATAELILSGRDGRTAQEFKDDNAWTAKADDASAVDKIDVLLFSASSGNGLITQPNVNKNIAAYKAVEIGVIWADDVMAPTAAHADILLPRATFFENTYAGLGGQGDIKILQQNIIRETMYDSRRTAEITKNVQYHIIRKLNENGFSALPLSNYSLYTPPADPDGMAAAETATKNLASSDFFDKATGTSWAADDNTWEQVKTKGYVQLNAPTAAPMIGMQHFRLPGGSDVDGNPVSGDFRTALNNSTGYVNFFSPFWDMKRQATIVTGTRGAYKGYSAGWRTSVAAHIPVREGYEEFFENEHALNDFTGWQAPAKITNQGSGRIYKLQFLTNKARNRAHTCQDNVAIIKDQFVQKAYINPIDAGERGIKDGDMVYVYNERGCTYIPAAVTHYIVPGVVSVEHGSWYRAHPTEKVTVYLTSMSTGEVTKTVVPVDVGGSENVLTDDSFIYDPQFINQTAGLHGGPVEVSLVKPE